MEKYQHTNSKIYEHQGLTGTAKYLSNAHGVSIKTIYSYHYYHKKKIKNN